MFIRSCIATLQTRAHERPHCQCCNTRPDPSPPSSSPAQPTVTPAKRVGTPPSRTRHIRRREERSSAERADCPAVLGLAAASPNSLRSLRSLRSDSGDEHVDERASRWPQALRSSAPQKARRTRPPHAFAAGLLVFDVSVGSGLVLQYCKATPDRHPRCNVAIQDLTPAPSAHEIRPLSPPANAAWR